MKKLTLIGGLKNSILYFLNEDDNGGKTIINVDIQPEYEDYISFNLGEWVEFINKAAKNNRIVFLYNGALTLGMIDESSYKEWLFELGVKNRVLNNIVFFDKGYAFFRYCMDNNINEDEIVDLLKFMVKHDVNDSRDINEEMWNSFMKEFKYEQSNIRDLIEMADDMIYIPDLMDFLSNYNHIILTGGGSNECLKEVEIALKTLGKKYDSLTRFIY